MIKKYLRKTILQLLTKDIVQDIKESVINELNQEPDFKLQLNNYQVKQNKDKINFWYVIANHKFREISLTYEFYDGLTNVKREAKFKNVQAFHKFMKVGIKLDTDLISVSVINLHVHWDYKGSSVCDADYGFGVTNSQQYSLKAVEDHRLKVLEWFEKHPELLI